MSESEEKDKLIEQIMSREVSRKEREHQLEQDIKEMRAMIDKFEKCDKCGMDPAKLNRFLDSVEAVSQNCVIL